ncbi:MAG: inorganic diphosphatase [Anaerolineaceae bacterium]|nr:inorganic diphosphatase [Anaerolineaceae bacterium]
MNNHQFLGTYVDVIIDRKIGSKHPVHGFEYPVNYGFIPNTVSGDDEELDAYILGIAHPLETFRGLCIAIVHRLDDNDDKLIVVSRDQSFTDKEIRQLTFFQEQWFKSEILRLFHFRRISVVFHSISKKIPIPPIQRENVPLSNPTAMA